MGGVNDGTRSAALLVYSLVHQMAPGSQHRISQPVSDNRFLPVPARQGLLGYWFGLSEGGWSICVARGRALFGCHCRRAQEIYCPYSCGAHPDVAPGRRSAGSIDRFSSRIRGRDCRKAPQTRPTLSSGLAETLF